MDELDRKILNALQYDFPLSERPYQVLAERLDIAVEELWNRVSRLMDEGVLRRIGASLDSGMFGFGSTLAAVSVPPEKVETAAETIGEYPEVTHSYQRSDEFNIWFTIIAESEGRIEQIIEQIRSALSLDNSQVLNLPVKRLFKLDARFRPQGGFMADERRGDCRC